MKVSSRQTTFLIILLVISTVYFGGGVYSLFDMMIHWADRTAMPFDFGIRGRVISNNIKPEARKAGAKWADTVLEIDGAPFTGREVMRDAVMAKNPGDILKVKLQHPSGKISEVLIKLGPRMMSKPTLSLWATEIIVQLLMPLFCVLLGFWVVLSRPHDMRAWLLLGMMLGFEALVPINGWPGVWFTIWIGWTVLLTGSIPVWIMLFGIHFPHRSPLDRDYPFAKWLMLTPLCLLVGEDVWFNVGKQLDFDSYNLVRPYIMEADTLRMAFSIAAVAVFFVSLGGKSFREVEADSRRRLRILWLGSAVGLVPFLIVAVIALMKGTEWGTGLPQSLKMCVMLVLTIFPLSLAQVIVAQREMNVRMVLRVGMQYALAQGGLRFIRTAVAVFAVIAFVDALDDTPGETKLQHFTAAAAGATLLLIRKTLSERVTVWVDKRFFREAYSSEKILSELSAEARKFVEAGPLLETVTKRIGQTLHIERVVVLRRHNGSYAGPGVELPEGSKTIRLLQNTDKPLTVYFDDENSWVHNVTDAERECLRYLNAQVLLPLSGREELMGVMSLGPKKSDEPYSRNDLRLLQSVASQTGLTMENTQLFATLASEAVKRERIARELEIAREVQERFFPQKFPQLKGLQCAGKCRPALGVGGDYFDFLNLPGGLLGIAIGDVSGKGISAALLMASLRASLRGQTIGGTTELAGLMSNMNMLVYEASTSNRYATFFYAQFDPATRLLHYVNAGHNSPVILRGDAELTLGEGGPVVGLLPRAGYSQASIELLPGDIFIGYTDGISEAMNGRDDEWGEEAMIKTAKQLRDFGPGEIIDGIIAEADRFADGAEQHDDMTLLVVKVLAE